MTLDDLMTLFVEEDDQKVIIFDTSKGENVFQGFYGEARYIYGDREVQSIDTIYTPTEYLTINI